MFKKLKHLKTLRNNKIVIGKKTLTINCTLVFISEKNSNDVKNDFSAALQG